MAPKFGTSGLRGLVVELTPPLVADHVQAFVASCPVGTGLFVGRDLRPSSPDIAGIVLNAARAMGVPVIDCGDIPTPALALAAMGAGAGAVMITGSHIPADRNGLKFYTPEGEITKDHEEAILAALGLIRATSDASQTLNTTAGAAYIARYVQAFGPQALTGMTIGAYTHSTVGRDIMSDVLRALGATVVELGRSDVFIPVDTEAVDPETRDQLATWAKAQPLDAIVSMDGDGDRPLLTDAAGVVVPGDVLGQITAGFLGADTVVTPVSSNTGAEAANRFAGVIRTRIGSPYVIAGMEAASGKVVGYEANGGFLLGFAAKCPAGVLAPLMTRDSMLPLLVPLLLAKGQGIAALVAGEPARFTAADRLQGVPTERSNAFVTGLRDDATARATFLKGFATSEAEVDTTDGLRITLSNGRIVHMRPSGNAPELRFYAEAETQEAAQGMLTLGLSILQKSLN